jgi:hypothetical protein
MPALEEEVDIQDVRDAAPCTKCGAAPGRKCKSPKGDVHYCHSPRWRDFFAIMTEKSQGVSLASTLHSKQDNVEIRFRMVRDVFSILVNVERGKLMREVRGTYEDRPERAMIKAQSVVLDMVAQRMVDHGLDLSILADES